MYDLLARHAFIHRLINVPHACDTPSLLPFPRIPYPPIALPHPIHSVLGLICAIPAVGSPFLGAKWAAKGLVRGSTKINKLVGFVRDAFTAGHIVFKSFADELAGLAKKAADNRSKLKSIGNAFKRMGSTLWFLIKEGRKVADEVAAIATEAATNPSRLKVATEKIGTFTKNVLEKIGCGKASKWMLVVFEKVRERSVFGGGGGRTKSYGVHRVRAYVRMCDEITPRAYH